MPNIALPLDAVSPSDITQQQALQTNDSTIFTPTRLLPPAGTNPNVQSQLRSLNKKITPVAPSKGTVAVAATAGPPQPVYNVSAAQSPLIVQAKTVSEITVTYSRDPSDTAYDHVNIWVAGYHGNSTPVEYASSTDSPADFTLESTGETVRIYVQAASYSQQVSAPTLDCPSTTVALSGVVSNPPAPSITTSVISTPFGFQFAFAQVILSVGTEDVIDSYRVYRNTTNNSGTASVIQSIKHNPTNSGSIVVQDQMEQYQTRYYWVSSVNTKGLESSLSSAGSGVSGAVAQGGSGQNLVFNGDFSVYSAPTGTANSLESAARVTNNPNGWTQNFENGGSPSEGVAYQRAIGALDGLAYPYGLVMQHAGPGLEAQFACVCDAFPVTGSAVYTFSAWIDTNLGVPTNATWYFRILWYQPGTTDFSRFSASFISFADVVSGSTTSTTAIVSKNLQAPSNAGYCRIAFYQWQAPGTTTTLWNLVVSNVQCREVATSIRVNSLNNKFTWVDASNNVLTNILTQSGTSLTVNVSSGIYWSTGFGKIGYNGGSVTVGAYATDYYIYSIDVGYNGGSPTISATSNFYNITANDWVVLYGSITCASGGGGGGGGGSGGGGDTCFTGNTRLADGRSFDSIRKGDFVLVEKDDGTRVQRRVKGVLIRPYSGPVFDMGNGELVTPEHPFRKDGAWVEAQHIFSDEKTYSGFIYHLQIDTEEADEHNFVLANGWCAHNFSTL